MMNNGKVRVQLVRIDGLLVVRVRAAQRAVGERPRWVMLQVCTYEAHTTIQPDVLGDLRAVPQVARQQRLRILGSEGLARVWHIPGLAFGELVLPNVTIWVHPLETLPEGIKDVLGLDVLDRLSAIINLRQNWLTLSSEEPAPA